MNKFLARLLCLGALFSVFAAVPAAAKPGLAAHRAIYDLSLDPERPSAGVSNVKGRMVYEFVGSACTSYVMKMRFVSELSDSDGKAVVTDLRAETEEEGDGSAFSFNSTQYVNSQVSETTLGSARRVGDQAIAVELKEPTEKSFDLAGATLFPTEHLLAIIAAARKGKRLLIHQVYDGSEDGEKVYDTTAAIGRPTSGVGQGQEVAANAPQLAGQTNWPVSIAYFEKNEGGEQVPDYQLSFDLYANGFSDGLRLDYGQFTLKGTLRQLEFIEQEPCD